MTETNFIVYKSKITVFCQTPARNSSVDAANEKLKKILITQDGEERSVTRHIVKYLVHIIPNDCVVIDPSVEF